MNGEPKAFPQEHESTLPAIAVFPRSPHPITQVSGAIDKAAGEVKGKDPLS